MKIDSHIVRAIEKFLSQSGTNYVEMAERIGVTPAAVTKWRKVGSGVAPERWSILFQMIKQYLPQDRIFIDDAGNEQYDSNTEHVSNYVFSPKFVPMMVPVFSIDQLSEYDDKLESTNELGIRTKTKMAECYPSRQVHGTIIALELAGRNYYGAEIGRRTTMFATTGEKPKDGGIVIVRPTSGAPIVGEYKKTGDAFTVRDMFRPDVEISGSVNNPSSVFMWIFPVMYYTVAVS
ncbi:MAG: hypothetical protein AB7F40_04605 [Victivallaceae bacterium]